MADKTLLEEGITKSIIGAFFEVYNRLGYGFLEQTYSLALERELVSRGHKVSREYTIVVYYKGEPLNRHRLDMVVDDKVIVENKSTERLPPFTKRQTFDYLRAGELNVGMVLHYGPSPSFHRVVCTTRNERND